MAPSVGEGAVRSCRDCGTLAADVDGPRHPYLSAAPGCWAVYNSLEEWKTGLVANGDVAVAQDLIDAYAAPASLNDPVGSDGDTVARSQHTLLGMC